MSSHQNSVTHHPFLLSVIWGPLVSAQFSCLFTGNAHKILEHIPFTAWTTPRQTCYIECHAYSIIIRRVYTYTHVNYLHHSRAIQPDYLHQLYAMSIRAIVAACNGDAVTIGNRVHAFVSDMMHVPCTSFSEVRSIVLLSIMKPATMPLGFLSVFML